ncbi:MAG TPA: ABC transporter permease subunit [Verrucomicrobiae bacterium]|nr:ABC transporter permease subunit [Verrucomicrobiae bacterium]
MSALPIIERELRVRARKPWTIWMRVIVGLLVSLLAIETLSWSPPRGWGVGTWRAGKALFDTLSGLLFLLCLVEGVRQTADSLSKEKRDGTLGFLFLTDLSGFDVVLGKLVAASLGSFYMLLAAFPAMALALLAGGLTAGEFWRTQLVLLNTLFFGVTAGMWASARHRQEHRALTAGLALVCALAVLPWMVEWPFRRLGLPNISPWVALSLADDSSYRAHAKHFWLTLAATHALGWWLLVAAGRRVQSGWREESEPGAAASARAVLASGLPVRPPRAWRLALAQNPAAWLADRLPTHRGLIWISILVLTLSIGLLRPGIGLGRAFHWATIVIPLLLLSFVATRSFAEARRDGAMELLLSTPLSPRAIVDAHWRALWRQVSVPFWLAAGIVAYFAGMAWLSLSAQMGFSTMMQEYWVLSVLADRLLRTFAVCWLGLYLGLRMGSATQAIGYCLLWTVGVPAVGTYLLWYVLSFLYSPAFGGMGRWGPWSVDFIPTLLSAAYYLKLAAWAQSRLRTRFRELAAGS